MPPEAKRLFKPRPLKLPLTHSAVKYGAVAATALALAFALGVFEAGIGPRVLPQMLMVLLGSGVVALLFGLGRVTNVAFGLGGVVAYVLMQSTSVPPDDPYAAVRSPGGNLEIEQYSTANLTDADSSGFAALDATSADIVAIQGLTPDWAAVLAERLRDEFPAQYLFPDIGLTGLGLFSRVPLGDVDTILLNGVVQVRACHTLPGTDTDVEIFAVQTLPPLSRETSLGLQAQLDQVSATLAREERPVILVGDLNAVPWSPVINRFTAQAGLRDSRRNELPSYEAGMPGLFESPVEHIFYTERLRCVRFETLRTASAAYLGNRASFQSADAPAEVVAL